MRPNVAACLALLGFLTFPCAAANTAAQLVPLGVTNIAYPVNTAFNIAVQTLNSDGGPIGNVSVTLSSPSTGPSGRFANGLHAITLLSDSIDGYIRPEVFLNATPGTFVIFVSTISFNFQVLTVQYTVTNIGPPAIMTSLPGSTPQATTIGTGFSHSLGIQITDAVGYPVPNTPVTFSAPTTGAAATANGTLNGLTFNTTSTGQVTLPVAANATPGHYTVIASAASGTLSVPFSLTNIGPAVSLVLTPGSTPQFTPTGTQFPNRLSAVLKDSAGDTVPSAPLVFVAPPSGPSGTFPNGTTQMAATSDANGTASLPFTANQTAGSYSVSAVLPQNPAALYQFALTNVGTAVAPTITQQPLSITVDTGQSVTFTATANGSPTPAVQWQLSTNAGITFLDIAGATSTSLNFTAAVTQNGTQYRAVFSNASGTVTTTAGILTVFGPPVITQNPADTMVALGAVAAFTAAASGNPPPTVQWQRGANGNFTNIEGATSTTYNLTTQFTDNAVQFRAVFTNVDKSVNTTAATLTVTGSGPTIRTADPVLPSFMGAAGFGSNMYVEIHGANFTAITRTWADTDFTGSSAPTQLEGVSVKINGKNAFVYFISPTQINVDTPDDTAIGPVTVQVFTPLGPSNTVTVTRSRLSPTLLTTPQFNVAGKQYVVATNSDFSAFVGPPNLIAGLNFATRQPGDTISIYAIGAGPTDPATQAGVVAATNAPLALNFQLKIGGVVSQAICVSIGGTVGVYQLNIVIPQVPPGDQPIEFIVDSVSNNQNLVISIGQ
jgi:uncharacterized protein (TIGR03437 family)